MAPNIQTVDEICSAFPHPEVPKIEGEPTLKALHNLLKSNAASIPTNLGGGAHGHLGLVMAAATYTAVTGVAFNAPANPGGAPVIPAGATAAQTNALTRTFNADLKEYLEYDRTDKALKQQVLGAVDPMYVDSLRNMHTGFTAVSTLDIMTHLYDNYGQISTMDLDDNEKRMKTKYDPAHPMDVLFKQIDDSVEFAATGNAPFTARQIVNTAFLLVFATGAYKDECKAWK